MAFDPISAALQIGSKVIDRVWPDPAEKAKAQQALLEMAQKGDLAQLDADVRLALGQLDVNKAEAQSGSLFVAGWRPYIGWVCGFGLTYQFVARPLIAWYSTMHAVPVPPELDMGTLVALLTGLLGLGGYRTYEKAKGVARSALGSK